MLRLCLSRTGSRAITAQFRTAINSTNAIKAQPQTLVSQYTSRGFFSQARVCSEDDSFRRRRRRDSSGDFIPEREPDHAQTMNLADQQAAHYRTKQLPISKATIDGFEMFEKLGLLDEYINAIGEPPSVEEKQLGQALDPGRPEKWYGAEAEEELYEEAEDELEELGEEDYHPEDDFFDDSEEKAENYDTSPSVALAKTIVKKHNLKVKMLQVKRVVQMTRQGKVATMWALVTVGNGNGLAGYAVGRASDSATAVAKATYRAAKRLVPIERFNGQTILQPLEGKHKKTVVVMRPERPGYGRRAHHVVSTILELAGIRDVSANTYGSRTTLNLVRCTFKTLALQRTVEHVARARGINVVDFSHAVRMGAANIT
eukprot:Colp12_sorted_trinity150504_noHs@22579